MAETINEPPPESAVRKVPPDLFWKDIIGDGFQRDDLPWRPWTEEGRDGVDMCPLFGSDPNGAAAIVRSDGSTAGHDYHVEIEA